MSSARPFQRARKPEEINLRREQLLAAAAELFDAEGPQGAGLSAIAAKAGFTKSNVYRYFESREQVLLELFRVEFMALVNETIAGLDEAPINDVAAIADIITAVFLGRPRCCALIAIMSSTLEQNVSEATIVGVKMFVSEQSARLVDALAARLPAASPADCAWVIAMAGTLIAGMWPSTNPPPAARAVLARAEFAHLRIDPARNLARTLKVLLSSIA